MTYDHEHAFFAHEDPRWLICDCGQYAVRARNLQGMREIRLIDPPKPIFAPRPPTDLRDCPKAKVETEAARAAESTDVREAATESRVSA